MITKIGRKGGSFSGAKTKSTIAILTYRTEAPSSGLVSPIGNIAFGDPYFRMATSANWLMEIDYFKTQSATIAQSTENSVNITVGIGSSNNNVLDVTDARSNSACPSGTAATISGIANVSSFDDSDERINFRHEDGGGIGRTVCNRLTLVKFKVLLLNGRDSVEEIDSANNPNFTHRFL